MAVTAKFIADFSDFNAQIARAEQELEKFQTGIASVDRSMSRFAQDFTGQRVVQQATNMAAAVESVGGASKLTDAEMKRVNATLNEAIAKYKVLGQDAPKAMIDLEQATRKAETATKGLDQPTSFLQTKMVALGSAIGSFAGNLGSRAVSALGDWTREAIASAGVIADLADKTGLSTDTIQRMSAVAEQSGSSMEAMTEAAYKLGIRVASGSGSVKSAFDELGLSIRDVQALSPDQMWDVVVTALSKVEDATERNRIGTDLFGKAFSGIAAGVNSGYQAMADGARVSSESQIRALDNAEKAWDKSVKTIKSGIVSVLGEAVLASERIGNAIGAWFATDSMEEFYQFLDGQRRAQEALDQTGESTDRARQKTVDYSTTLAAARAELEALDPSQRAQIKAALELGVSMEKLSNELGISEEALSLYKDAARSAEEAQKQAAAEARKFGEAMGELNSAGLAWSGTLATVNGDVAASVKYYLEAGVSQNALATAYALTATQVKAVASALKQEQEVMEITRKSVEETAELWREYAAMKVEQGGTAVDVQVAQIQRWFDNEVAKLKDSDDNWVAHYQALEAVAGEKMRAIELDWATVGENSKAQLQQTADKAEAVYRYMLERVDQFSVETVQKFRATADAARSAADAWDMGFTTALDNVSAKATQTTDVMVGAADRLASQILKTNQILAGSFENPYALSSGMSAAEQAARAAAMGGSVARDDYGNAYIHVAGKNAPGRAMGGPVMAGRAYTVGERGQELFVPSQSGRIVPNHALGGSTVVVNIDAREGYWDSSASQQRLAKRILDALRTQTRTAGAMA